MKWLWNYQIFITSNYVCEYLGVLLCDEADDTTIQADKLKAVLIHIWIIIKWILYMKFLVGDLGREESL